MTINEDPSPNLIGRQVDNSVLAVQINDIYRCTAAYPVSWGGGGGGLAPKASYAIMLQVYDDYYVLTAICTT